MKRVLCYLLIERSRGLPWTNHKSFRGIEFPPVFLYYLCHTPRVLLFKVTGGHRNGRGSVG